MVLILVLIPVLYVLSNPKTPIRDRAEDIFGEADKDFEYLNEQGVTLREKRYCDWMTRAEAISLIAKTIKSLKG